MKEHMHSLETVFMFETAISRRAVSETLLFGKTSWRMIEI